MSPQYNRTLGHLRVATVWISIGALLYVARPTPTDVIAGTVFVALGEAIRLWAAGHLIKTKELITSGPYAYTRNPLYLGRLLIFTGVTVMARLPWSLHLLAVLPLGWAIFFGYYLPRKERVEPARLEQAHGDRYRSYKREVPSLLPRPTRWNAAGHARWSLGRALTNREVWMVLALTGVAVWMASKIS